MKFIKYYKIFEGSVHQRLHDDMETVKEICYDLTDEGNWSIEYNMAGTTIDPSLFGIKYYSKGVGYLCFHRPTSNGLITFKFDDIRETVTRLVDYFGIANQTTSDRESRYLGSSFQPEGFNVGYKGFTKTDGESIRKYGDSIKYFIIWFILPDQSIPYYKVGD